MPTTHLKLYPCEIPESIKSEFGEVDVSRLAVREPPVLEHAELGDLVVNNSVKGTSLIQQYEVQMRIIARLIVLKKNDTEYERIWDDDSCVDKLSAHSKNFISELFEQIATKVLFAKDNTASDSDSEDDDLDPTHASYSESA